MELLLSLKSIVCEGANSCTIPVLLCVTLAMRLIPALLALAVCTWAQSQPDTASAQKHGRGPGKEIGSGAGDIGKGTAKGVGNLAKGTGKGALDLVTLHPINAASSLGKGAGAAGKDVGMGTVKGTAKIGKGIGKGIKKIF
jgi:hypothetical protein